MSRGSGGGLLRPSRSISRIKRAVGALLVVAWVGCGNGSSSGGGSAGKGAVVQDPVFVNPARVVLPSDFPDRAKGNTRTVIFAGKPAPPDPFAPRNALAKPPAPNEGSPKTR